MNCEVADEVDKDDNTIPAKANEASKKVSGRETTDSEFDESEVRPRKSQRITELFVFNEENVTRGRYEQFTDLKDMILHFIKSYRDREIKDYIKIVKRSDKSPYETLRIPKAVQEACYTKLKTFMVIKETQISPRKKLYYVEEVYDRQYIKDGK